MKAIETRLVDFLRKSNQFLIPIFQRPYSWTGAQCRQLWDDLVRLIERPQQRGHFLGSIVYVERGLYTTTEIPQLLVIDGQQRLTTTVLLLDALGRHIDEHGAGSAELTRAKIQSRFLFNPGEDGDLRYKLLLARSDRATLCRLIDDLPAPADASPKIRENRDLFAHWIRECRHDAGTIHDAIARLQIVDIALDRTQDNPQVIFESLNSTGLDLSESDLIRNHVLLGLDPKDQDRLYSTWWQGVESVFTGEGRDDHFDRFMRAWLAARTGELPSAREIYREFKALRDSKDAAPVQEVVEDIYHFARHYEHLAFGGHPDAQIAQRLTSLRALRMDAANPLVLTVLEDLRKAVVDRDGALAVLAMLESYLFRRVACDIPSNVLSRTFATLGRAIDHSHYAQSFAAILMTRDSKSRFPSDAEFEQALRTRNVYEWRNRDYLLAKLENAGRKEPVRISEQDYTVEHILPQNPDLGSEWKQMLGSDWKAIRERWLHTLGNLTLTAYNAELGDRPFAKKVTMKGGFADTPIRLSRGLATLDSWDATAIDTRGTQLAKQALALWKTIEAPEELLERYRTAKTRGARVADVEAVEHVRRLTGTTRSLYDALLAAVREMVGEVREHPKPTLVEWARPVLRDIRFARVLPLREGLKVRVRLPFLEVESPPAWCSARSTPRGDQALLLVRSGDQIAEAARILKQAADRSLQFAPKPFPEPATQPERDLLATLLKGLAACRAHGYGAPRFVQMLRRRGPAEACRRMLRPGKPQDGLKKVVALGLLQHSVEHIVQQPAFRGLFQPEELAIARDRLDQAAAD
jgi:uncharacterized protein with ParB-like and HNH nuclease domain